MLWHLSESVLVTNVECAGASGGLTADISIDHSKMITTVRAIVLPLFAEQCRPGWTDKGGISCLLVDDIVVWCSRLFMGRNLFHVDTCI